MNEQTFIQIIMEQIDTFQMDLCCFTVTATPSGDGFYYVNDVKIEGADNLKRFTITELTNYMRNNNCWSDEDRTIQYFNMDGKSYKMVWAKFEDRWTYMGTAEVDYFD